MTCDGLLPCTKIKQGYLSGEEFLEFLHSNLIPALRERYGVRPLVIVMDNCSTHTNEQVEQLLRCAGYIVQYLSPYSPDFNQIDLVFSVLKAWIRRWYFMKRRTCEDFGEYTKNCMGCFRVSLVRHQAGEGQNSKCPHNPALTTLIFKNFARICSLY